MTMNRRALIASATALSAFAIAGCSARAQQEGENYPVTRTPEEWKAILSPEAYAVLREEATERPFSSSLLEVKETGIYSCAGCENPVYPSNTKYESGTGWPSFWAPISEAAIGTKTDFKLVYPRTEVHCARCGGHLGHIFDDGPEPTGKRHCLNGVALDFRPGDVSPS